MCYVGTFQQAACRHSLETDLNFKFVITRTMGGLLVLLQVEVVSGPIILRESQETITRVAAAPNCMKMKIIRAGIDNLILNTSLNFSQKIDCMSGKHFCTHTNNIGNARNQVV
jgi:hypothetical protein